MLQQFISPAIVAVKKTATGMSFEFSIGPSHPISEIATRVSHRCCEQGGGGGGGSSKFDGGGLKSWGELKMLLKNTCEGVHLIVKLLAISLQASKFTKNGLLHTYFSRILVRF